MTNVKTQAIEKPRILLQNKGATLRVYAPLAAEIGFTPSVILLQIDWWMNHDRPVFRDGNWWLEFSLREMARRLSGCITPESIRQNLIKLQKAGYILLESGAGKYRIALNILGLKKTKSIEVSSEVKKRKKAKKQFKSSLKKLKKRVKNIDSTENEQEEGVKNIDNTVKNIDSETPEVSKKLTELSKKLTHRDDKDSFKDIEMMKTKESPENQSGEAKSENHHRHQSEEKKNVFQVYSENIGNITEIVANKLKALQEDYSDEWIIESIENAVLRNARNLKYITATLENWRSERPSPIAQKDPIELDKIRKEKAAEQKPFRRPTVREMMIAAGKIKPEEGE